MRRSSSATTTTSATCRWARLLGRAGAVSAALVVLGAGPAFAIIGDGAEDDGGDPVIGVSCTTTEVDGVLQEVCAEAQKGEPGPVVDEVVDELPDAPDAPVDPDVPADPGAPELPEAPETPQVADEGPGIPGSTPSGTAVPSEPVAPSEPTDTDASARSAQPAVGSTPSSTDGAAPAGAPAPVAALPNTGLDDVDPLLLGLGLLLTGAGSLLVRRSRQV